MCGIAGIWLAGSAPGEARAAAVAMAARLTHRGPDGDGVWDDGGGVALSHRRLAIIDPTPAGAQPMSDADGRWTLTFNGEIYNHAELRAQLRWPWRSGSDTETLLAACAQWGVAAALERLDGMFAFALWDGERRELHLARDRMGEKPLYWGALEGGVAFASELGALRAAPGWRGGIDPDALAWYLRLGYVPEPWSIHPGIRKLPPGHRLVLTVPAADATPEPYWSLAEAARAGRAAPLADAEAAADALERELRLAVRRQMVADVPLGCFLSGGVDSSTIAALMQAQSPRPVRTFTIGFADAAFDEAPFARAVAQRLGTEHVEDRVSAADALAVVPALPAMYGEPFGDSSQIPTHLVARAARRHVTVALSGDGADELFAGYHRHALGARWLATAARVPRALRRPLATGLGSLRWLDALSPARRRVRGQGLGSRAAKAAAMLGAYDDRDRWLAASGFWREGELLPPPTAEPAWPDASDGVGGLLAGDQALYLPGDILAKVDRATMAASLESRAPFLARAVVELSWRFPASLQLGDGGKAVLKRVARRHLPDGPADRPKAGFSLPLGSWLRGELRPWAEALLRPDRLEALGLAPAPVLSAWRAHQTRRRDDPYRLWIVLMLVAWAEAARP